MALGLTESTCNSRKPSGAGPSATARPSVIRAAIDGPDADPRQLPADARRPGLAEQGLLGLHVPDEHGGQGYGLTELAVALEELGRALVPGASCPR